MGYLQFGIFFLLLPLMIICGCLPSTKSLRPDSTDRLEMIRLLPTVRSVEKSNIAFDDISYDALTIVTAHYTIHTTSTDRLILRRLPMLLESAYQNFKLYAPVKNEQVGTIYYFKNRDQWLSFTKHFSGRQASTFEKIHSGAYCYQDVCVAWQINRAADFSVLTHEAWHQYCGLNMADTLPSWLAESSAVYLESFIWDSDGLKFSPRHNLNRLWDLKRTMQAGISFPISKLVRSDPGSILDTMSNISDQQKELIISSYYAHLYALARFMFEYEYGIYRKGYTAIYSDAVSGNLQLSAELRDAHELYSQTRLWSARAGYELFQSYITEPTGEVELQFRQFCGKLASSVRRK